MEFSLHEQGINDIKSRSRKRSLVMRMIIVPAVFVIFLGRNDWSFDGLFTLQSLITFGLTLLFFSIFSRIGVNRGLNRLQQQMESFTLSITDDALLRRQLNTPDVKIPKDEVKRITRSVEGSLSVRGSGQQDVIHIPAGIENQDALEAQLNQICPITVSSQPTSALSWLLVSAAIGSMVGVYISTHKWVVATCGIFTVAVLLWALIAGTNNKQLDRRTKRALWIILLPTAAVIGVMYFKLIGT